MKPNIVSRYITTIFLFSISSFVYAQAHPENFVIKNVQTGLVLDIEGGCNLNPDNTTDGGLACSVTLSPYVEGKASQLWKISEGKGFISLQNVAFKRFLQANSNVTIISRSNESFYFKPVAAKDDSYVLLQTQAGKDANGNPSLTFSYNTLQPAGGNAVHFVKFDEKQEALQSWKLVPVKEKTTDFSAVLNQSQTITNQQANEVSKKLLAAPDAKALVKQAKELEDKKDFEGANKLLQQAVQLEPENDTANIELAGTYWAKKDYANATLFAEKAKSLNPNNELTWNLLGLIARDQQQWEKAISFFQTVVEINPRANISFANLAYCYDNIGKPGEAIANYTKAIDISVKSGYKPESYMYNNRGSAYRKINNVNEAIADYRKALQTDPGNSMAKKNLEEMLKLQQQNTPVTLTIDASPTAQPQKTTTTPKDINQGKGDYYQTCRVCCGLGKVNNDGYLEGCPECDGKGKVPVGHNYTHIPSCK